MTVEEAINALASGSWTPAITTILGHLAHDRSDGAAWMYLGIAYSEIGHQDASLEALSNAERYMAPNAELDEAFGCTYLRMDRFGEARTYLERATASGECPASVYRNLSIFFLKTGELDNALTAVETALQVDGDDALSLYAMVLVLVQIRNESLRNVDDELRSALDAVLNHPGTPADIADSAMTIAGNLTDNVGNRQQVVIE